MDNHSLNIYLDAYAVPTICQPIVNQPFDWSKYPHLKGVIFSDECVGELGIDILIGADFYWRLITGEVRRGGGGMMVWLRLGTRLGYVLSGPVNVCFSGAQVMNSGTSVLRI